MVENVTLSIPTLPDGIFDLETQNEVAESYRKVQQVKEPHLLELQKIISVSIDI